MTTTVNGREFDYLTLRHSQQGSIDVLGWSTYPESSALAGQPMKVFLDNVPDETAARAAYPQALGFNNRWTEPQVSVARPPGPDDMVPGGAMPNGITDPENRE